MYLKIAAGEAQLEKIRQLYEEAFPKSEKKPFEMMLKMREEGIFEFWVIEDEAESFCGLAIMILYGEIALLDYFAIAPQCRGTGVGSSALKALQEKYVDKKFLLEIESTVDDLSEISAEESSLRLRRKAFYLRNGMTPMDFRVNLFGVDMEILTHDTEVTFEEYHAVFENILPGKLAENVRLL